MKKLMTLCMVFREEKMLLGMKKRGFGEGRWNGFGGKVGEGESIEEAAVRELREEVGLKPLKLEKVGVVNFSFLEDPKQPEVHIFKVEEFEGEPVESEEMRPQWFSKETIPLEEMWPGDRQWLPYLLEGKKFEGEFVFDKPSSPEHVAKVISSKIYLI